MDEKFNIIEEENKEIKKIMSLYIGADEETMTLVKPMIENCAFMKVTLDRLQNTIREKGAVDIYQNGNNQSGVKSSAEMQTYNKLIVTYNNTIKTLNKLLDETKIKREEDAEYEREMDSPLMKFEKLKLGLPIDVEITKREVKDLRNMDADTRYKEWKKIREEMGKPYFDEDDEECEENE